jgi:DNA-binding GntR family transcriptional regulator
VPRYRHAANLLRERILRGEYKPGERLPTEPALCAETGYARETVRSAIRVLRRENLVEVVIGVGTFVRPKDEWNPESRT